MSEQFAAQGRIAHPKHLIVVPSTMHQALRLYPGDSRLFRVSGDSVVLRKQPTISTGTMRGVHEAIWMGGRVGLHDIRVNR